MVSPPTNPTPACRERGLRICLWGCAPETDNLGVSALFVSAAAAIYRRDPGADLTVFDFGRGARSGTVDIDGQAFAYRRLGGTASRRWWRAESLTHLRRALRTGGWASAGARAMRRADLILDLSAGDSFTDLYGPRRFDTVCGPKELARLARRPLVLLPQTLGPFNTPAAVSRATALLQNAHQVWARDAESFDRLRGLLDEGFDPARHRLGVDLAFALPAAPPADALPTPLGAWLGHDVPTVVGLNVSGLIYNDPSAAAQRFGLQADYRAVVWGFLNTLLDEPDTRVVLTPHVLSAPGYPESDLAACQDLLERVVADRPEAAQRIAVLPRIDDPGAIKHLIGRFDWFCGTRMHSTIAALSSGVPTAALAYSLKTRGVFETVGLGHATVDPRSVDTATCVAELTALYRDRDRNAAVLRAHLPDVRRRADAQFDEILAEHLPGGAAAARRASDAAASPSPA